MYCEMERCIQYLRSIGGQDQVAVRLRTAQGPTWAWERDRSLTCIVSTAVSRPITCFSMPIDPEAMVAGELRSGSKQAPDKHSVISLADYWRKLDLVDRWL